MVTRDAEASQQRILAAAASAVQERGEGSLRIDAIAQAAEINKRMIYHYFGNREGLIAAVRDRQWASVRQALAAEDADVVRALSDLAPRTTAASLMPDETTDVGSAAWEVLADLRRRLNEDSLERPEGLANLLAALVRLALPMTTQDLVDLGPESGSELVQKSEVQKPRVRMTPVTRLRP